MNERLLHFIWKNRYFNQFDLQTTSGLRLKIIDPGIHNLDQGPDFLMGKLIIDYKEWIGNIELHVHASDWIFHGHQNDVNYENVIMHVVWINDLSESHIPVLELIHIVPFFLLDRYQLWMNNADSLPCAKTLMNQKMKLNKSWLNDLLTSRIQRKGSDILNKVKYYKYDWEEIFWHELAKTFGYRVNAETFELLAKSIPWKVLLKHKNSIHQIEAMLFGQINLLNAELHDQYARMLFKEYQFLKNKYSFRRVFSKVYFLRMRPRNFPTIRLAQLSALIAKNGHLFTKVVHAKELNELKDLLDVLANDYWNNHYLFDIHSDFVQKRLGNQMIQTIIINVFLPFIYAYEMFNENEKNQKIEWLMQLSPEKNFKIECFYRLGIGPKNAWESQAMIELKTEFCDKRKCLDCFLGRQLLAKTY